MPQAITEKEWRRRAREIHGNTYDYSQVVWRGMSAPVTLICKVHGSFKVYAKFHTQNKCGCRACGLAKPRKYTTESFLFKARKVHGDTMYDYTKTKFTNITAKITVTCPIHGDFKQSAHNHINGHGCPSCKADEASVRLAGHHMQYAKTKTVYVGGHRHVVQSSAEILVLNKLVKKNKVLAQDKCPIIGYMRNKKKRNHRPDFYLPDSNRLVEVKSTWSLGVIDSQLKSDTFATCKLKARAAIAQGFIYSVVVVKHRQCVVLPDEWLTWSTNRTMRYLRENFCGRR